MTNEVDTTSVEASRDMDLTTVDALETGEGLDEALEAAVEDAQTPSIVLLNLNQDSNGVMAVTIIGNTGDEEYEPGHHYQVLDLNTKDDQQRILALASLNFQKGPVKEVGVNGVTTESLLAILIHRTKTLNENFPCDENTRAIDHLENALANLEARTYRRQVRGVEGFNVA